MNFKKFLVGIFCRAGVTRKGKQYIKEPRVFQGVWKNRTLARRMKGKRVSVEFQQTQDNEEMSLNLKNRQTEDKYCISVEEALGTSNMELCAKTRLESGLCLETSKVKAGEK